MKTVSIAWARSALQLLLASTLEQQICVEKPLANRTLASSLHATYYCSGVSREILFPYIWAPAKHQLTCTTSQYDVFVAGSEEELSLMVENYESLQWCGFGGLQDRKTCHFDTAPHEPHLVAVKLNNWAAAQGLLSEETSCAMEAWRQLDARLPVLTAAGIWLFFNAGFLSTSSGFRVTTGAFIFTLASLLVFAFFIVRQVPGYKKGLGVLAVLGSSALGFIRLLYGVWMPSVNTLARSRLVQAYTLVSALLGMAITYYFDDTSNTKLNNILQKALQLLGLVLTFFSTTMVEASALLVASLITVHVAGSTVLSITRWVAAFTWWVLKSPFRVHRRWAPGPPVPPPAPPPLSPRAQLPAPQPEKQEEEEAEVTGPPPSSPWRDVIQRVIPRTPSLTSPGGQRPPASSALPPGSVRRSIGFESPESPEGAASQASSDARARPSVPGTGAGQAASSAQAVDMSEPQMVAVPPSPAHVSLYEQGLILNVETGRTIKIGGATFNKLLDKGYEADFERGVMVPGVGGAEVPQGQSGARARSGARAATRSGGAAGRGR